ncbi:armadillo-type protein [Xylaria flabelliformis]|nr:armadillo-type protein [Xylaria flabelliformis]
MQLKTSSKFVQTEAVKLLKLYPSDNIASTVTSFLKEGNVDHTSREAVFELLGAWPQRNDEGLEIICAHLKSHDKYNQVSSIRALGNWPKISSEILDIVMARLEDHDKDIRKSTIKALWRWPKLGYQILKLIAANLNDEYSDVRFAAVCTLADQHKLSHKILEAIKARAQDENENPDVRRIAIRRLMYPKQLGDNICDFVTTWLQGEKRIRCYVLEPLREWPKPSNEIVDIVAAQLEEDSGESKVVVENKLAAISALANWSPLSDSVLEVIAVQLSDSNTWVRWRVATEFGMQLQSNNKIFFKATVARRTGQSHEDRHVIRQLILALKECPQLDDDVFYTAAELLASRNDDLVVSAVIIMFQAQPQPNDDIIKAIAKHLETPSHLVRQAALRAMGNWSRLSNEFIIAIAAC